MSGYKILTFEELRSKYKPIGGAPQRDQAWPFKSSTVQQITRRQTNASSGEVTYHVKFKEGSTGKVAFDILKKTNLSLVKKYEKSKTSLMEDSDSEEEGDDDMEVLKPIKKRMRIEIIERDDSENVDDELDAVDSSEESDEGFDSEKEEKEGGRKSSRNRNNKVFYGTPSLSKYQEMDDSNERLIFGKSSQQKKNSFIGYSYHIPLYIDEKFIEKHADHCFSCHKRGYPNGKNDNLEDVVTGPLTKEKRLLLCKTCSIACHNTCLPKTADHCFNKLGNYVCSKCQSAKGRCAVCHSTKREANEDKLLFRCSTCFRGLHRNCRNPKDHECYHHNQCFECYEYTRNDRAPEKVLAQKTANSEKLLLIKWKEMSYRHVDWVSTEWLEYAHVTFYRSYQRKANDGEIPSGSAGPALEEWKRIDRILSIEWSDKTKEKAKRVLAVYRDTSYDEAVWDEPPSESETACYKAYIEALKRYRLASNVIPPEKMKSLISSVREMATNEAYSKHEYKTQPSFIKGGQLMPHQMEALNFLLYKWETKQSCILADDMGLGKTIQVISFFSVLFNKYKIYPFLLCVPNSTATNWVREFQKWAPEMVVVPYWGGQKSQQLSIKYELFGKKDHSKALKCHVVVTTYQSIMDSNPLIDISWAGLVIDESQRLKNDQSIMFKKLQTYKIDHTVLLTGTPLQNNLRELFNIMHFIQPKLFNGIEASQYDDMTPAMVEELHNRLRPFFLRRTKEEVLKQLPPKYEIIVPLSMTSVQKETYKSALGGNLSELLSNMNVSNAKRTKGLASILMNLRKILNHPYLIDGVEVPQPDEDRTVREMINACEKLKIFHMMLPKLRAKKHRILLFSTMTRALDVVEDYLNHEDIRFCRLDGSYRERDRVRNMDAFNAPDSEIDVFLLSTRAGGVGINLATADTVIFWDSDFNPYADAQAIGRAHRIGQTKMVLIFRFMTRLSVEEKILQIGKKKMALEHVVVERMAEQDNTVEDIESILKYGAKSLFDNDDSADIHYDEKKIDALLEREQYRKAAEEQKRAEIESSEKNGEDGAMNFSYAKVWKSNGETEEIEEDSVEQDDDFWSKFLEQKQQEAERKKEEKAQELLNMGRGARKRKRPTSYREQASKPHPSLGYESNDEDFKPPEEHSPSEDSEEDAVDDLANEFQGLRSSGGNFEEQRINMMKYTYNTMDRSKPKKQQKQQQQQPPITLRPVTLPTPPAFDSDTLRDQWNKLEPTTRLRLEKEWTEKFQRSFVNLGLRGPELNFFTNELKSRSRHSYIQKEIATIKSNQLVSYLPLVKSINNANDFKERHEAIMKSIESTDKQQFEKQTELDLQELKKMEELVRPRYSTASRKNKTSPPSSTSNLQQTALIGIPGGITFEHPSNGTHSSTVNQQQLQLQQQQQQQYHDPFHGSIPVQHQMTARQAPPSMVNQRISDLANNLTQQLMRHYNMGVAALNPANQPNYSPAPPQHFQQQQQQQQQPIHHLTIKQMRDRVINQIKELEYFEGRRVTVPTEAQMNSAVDLGLIINKNEILIKNYQHQRLQQEKERLQRHAAQQATQQQQQQQLQQQQLQLQQLQQPNQAPFRVIQPQQQQPPVQEQRSNRNPSIIVNNSPMMSKFKFVLPEK